MNGNPTLDILMNRASTRKFKPEMPERGIIDAILRAGQQAPFASQLYSVILCTEGKFAFGAPLSLVICVDAHRLRLFMKKRGWDIVTNNLTLLLLGIQDAAYMAQNLVVAAESLGLGSCFLGESSMSAERVRHLVKKHDLPELVLPLVELVLGYPAEEATPRPRFPLSFTVFENRYPEFGDEALEEAMAVMDSGYLAQDYYKKSRAKIRIEGDKKDEFTFDSYSWTEHISRKWGQWAASPNDLLEVLAERGFSLEKT